MFSVKFVVKKVIYLFLKFIFMKKIHFILISTILILSNCSSYKSAASYEISDTKNSYKETTLTTSSTEDLYFENTQGRKIIYNSYLTLIVKNQDSANVKISEIASKYDGYVQTIGTTNSKIRVKSENLYKALADIELLGKTESKSITGEDVTDQYTDFEIRLENAEKARTRYLELLELAANVQETLLVEKELERLNGEIDQLKGKMTKIEHLTEYSTITIYLKEKIKPGVVGYAFIGIYQIVKWLFVRN